MGIAGVEYDSSAGICYTSLKVKSTIIPMVLSGFEFWALLLMNSTVCILKHMGVFDPAEYHFDLPWGLTGVTGSLMTFFVCFYNQHVFGRYNKLYDLTKKMCESCLEVVSFTRIQVPNKGAQRKIAKLVISSLFMFFFERSESDADLSNLSNREFKQLEKLELLTAKEISQLQKHCKRYTKDALPSFLALMWACEIMRRVTPEPESRDDMLAGFYGRVYDVRKSQAEVCQILDLPMPFQYFHIMNLMLMLNLVLWAYSLGCQNSYFAPFIYMFVQMMFQGIRELSTALSNPFGDDEVDFPVTDWMITVYARMYGLLHDPFDVTKIDLDQSVPLFTPEHVRENNMIDVYVDFKPQSQQNDLQRSSSDVGGYQAVSQNEEEYSEEEYSE
jgi:predicted membrane chloride channel (bestrophin family)